MVLRDGRRLATAIAVVALTCLTVAACGDDDDDEADEGESEASASGAGAEEDCVLVGNSEAEPTATVEVNLAEFAIAPVPAEVPAGTVEFVAVNDGEEPHEVVIARYDGEPGDIPVDDSGAADESQLPADAVIGEIEGFASGNTCSGAFDLEAGQYALFCNIVEEEDSGEMEAHFSEGMHTTFTVG
ncbi:MAG: hypothetical protein ACRD2C_04560 [Acidimicrobiales bacterium]